MGRADGVVFAGFMKIVLPLLVSCRDRGIQLFPGLPDKDRRFPTLVRETGAVGLSGVVMAAWQRLVVPHSSVLNSCSTVSRWTLRPSSAGTARTSTWSGSAAQRGGHPGGIGALAIVFQRRHLGVFDVIQNVGRGWRRPSRVFLLGVLWRRTTPRRPHRPPLAFPYTWLLESSCSSGVLADAFDNWLNAVLVWATCMVSLVVLSTSRAPDPERIRGIIWSWRVAALPESERDRNRGVRNLFLWWHLHRTGWRRSMLTVSGSSSATGRVAH